MNLKKCFYLLPIIFLILTCSNDETVKLIDTSISTGNFLSQYYDKLINYTIDTWELEAFNSSIREIEFTTDEQKEYQKTIESLEARKKLVDSFVKMLPLLKDLAENKAPDNLNGAVNELGNNINDIKPLMDNKIIIPSSIFGNLSGDIMEIYKYYELRSIAKSLVKILGNVKTLFEKESDMYASIIEERNNKSKIVINYMIDNELVVPWSLIESAPGTVGLELMVDKRPAKDPKAKAALKKVIEVKYTRMSYLVKQAETGIDQMLGELLVTYNEYIKGNKIVFENIMHIAGRTNVYFSEVNKYVDTVTGKINYTATSQIIYHGNTDAKVFHQPNCIYYLSKNATVLFYSRDEAIKAGYAPCSVCLP